MNGTWVCVLFVILAVDRTNDRMCMCSTVDAPLERNLNIMQKWS